MITADLLVREVERPKDGDLTVAGRIAIPEPAVIIKAESYVGRKYGYAKLLAHWADWVLQGAYVFRRLTSRACLRRRREALRRGARRRDAG
jgi:hypothetical protein